MKPLILAPLAALTGLTFASGVASATGSGDQDAVSYSAEMNAAATSASDYVTATQARNNAVLVCPPCRECRRHRRQHHNAQQFVSIANAYSC